MDAKHSPAPWTSAHDGHGGVCISDADGRQVGFVSLRKEQSENAYLIRNAPDLLAAVTAQHKAIDLLMAMLIVVDETFMPSKSKVWPLIEEANAHVLIAKARGEA